ncbi:hypothetical protein VPH35_128529 [Triticum aestivum]
MVAALQDSQWRHLGADGRVDGEHRRVHGVGVPEGGWRAALHQPPQARPPRRPHRGQGEPHPVPPPRRVLGQGPAAGRGALDLAGGEARLRPALGHRPSRRRLLDRPSYLEILTFSNQI